MEIPALDLASLRAAYAAGTQSPTSIIRAVHVEASIDDLHIFTHVQKLAALEERCATLERQPKNQRGQLWGVPCAVKDNVDVAGMPTTAGCESFAYTPTESAPAIESLVQQGAIIIGKTNMDQFASGLVGTRTPFGVPVNPFDHRFITGGSSSGSGAAVGRCMVTFAIGTDTAGSGRIPAGFNGCVGIKPTLGSISVVGVVPACASLDCLSVFAQTVTDGAEVAAIMKTGSPGRASDKWRRDPPPAASPPPSGTFTFGVPSAEFLDWTGPGGVQCQVQYQDLFSKAQRGLQALGGRPVEVDFKPFATAAAALYGGAFVAERYSGIRKFLEKVAPSTGEPLQDQAAVASDPRLLPVIRSIISGAGKFTAADLFDDISTMAALKARAAAELSKVDLLLVPTALHHYTVREIQQQEDCEAPVWHRNANLGKFTNFVNLMDMCGVAVPFGVVRYDAAKMAEDASEEVQQRKAHLSSIGGTSLALPFGVTLLGKAWADPWLAGVAEKLQAKGGVGCGPKGHGVDDPVRPPETPPAREG